MKQAPCRTPLSRYRSICAKTLLLVLRSGWRLVGVRSLDLGDNLIGYRGDRLLLQRLLFCRLLLQTCLMRLSYSCT